jgi:hypothetical protein
VSPDWIVAALGVAGVVYHAGLLTANLRELRRITADHEQRIRAIEHPPIQPASHL